MLMSRKSDTHNHLSRRIGKKHDGLHTVTSGAHRQSPENAEGEEQRERPFKPIQYDASAEIKPNSKSIFGL